MKYLCFLCRPGKSYLFASVMSVLCIACIFTYIVRRPCRYDIRRGVDVDRSPNPRPPTADLLTYLLTTYIVFLDPSPPPFGLPLHPPLVCHHNYFDRVVSSSKPQSMIDFVSKIPSVRRSLIFGVVLPLLESSLLLSPALQQSASINLPMDSRWGPPKVCRC